MAENRDSCDCRRVANYDAIEKIGDFYWNRARPDGVFVDDPAIPINYLTIWVPGTTRPSGLSVQKGNDPHDRHTWGWDGNEDKPTLTPSMHYVGYWYGYLNAGRLESV